MKYLVTGGAGFVGTNLIKRLLKDGRKVVSIDNYSTGYKENEQDGCQYFDVDITETKDYSFLMDKPDVIFHMAALPRIQPSFKNPTEVIDVNVRGTLNVLEFARECGTSVIYAGSSSVHSGRYENPYTFSKLQGEELCLLYTRLYGLQTSICRFYNVYGDNMIDDGEYRTVLSIFKEQSKNGKPLTITGDGKQKRDFTHVDDIVDAMVKLANLNSKFSIFDKSFNEYQFLELGRGENYSINEIADAFGGERNYIKKREGEAEETLCVSKIARKGLGWNPKTDVIEWIKNLDLYN